MKKPATQGAALIISLVLIAVLSVVIAGSLYMSVVNRKISSNDASSAQALSIAQAGAAYWKSELVSLYQFMTENIDLYEAEISAASGSISCNNYFAIGLDLDRDGSVDQKVGSSLPPIKIPLGDTTGNATVTFNLRGSAVGLESVGEINGARATIVEEFNISNIDLWNNAVFAADGAGQATIQGRAEIRGAIHLLGEGLTSSDMALDVTGSFGLGNTYRNLSQSLKISEMRLTNPDPKDLCATLRVKNGYVQMGGSAQIGYRDDQPTDELMHRMRGIYTNNPIREATDANIFSENGYEAAYDAGDQYQYPYLNDAIVDDNGIATTRGKQLASVGLTLSAQHDPNKVNVDDRYNPKLYPPPFNTGLSAGDYYLSPGCYTTALFGQPKPPIPSGLSLQLVDKPDIFTPVLSVLAMHPLGQSLVPLLTLKAQRGNSSNSGGSGGAATGFVLDHGSTPSFSCAKYRVVGSVFNNFDDELVSEISWDKSNHELSVKGVTRFVGDDLTLTGGNGNNVQIGYKGEGILFAESDSYNPSTGLASDYDAVSGKIPGNGGAIVLEVDVLPAVGESYPLSTIVGLVARDTIVTGGSQKRYTAAMYAQESIDITKQTLIAGALVTRVFKANSQVPTVLYVPNLANRIPKLMPGAGGNGYTVSNFSWVRR